jgi:hypothetical protein
MSDRIAAIMATQAATAFPKLAKFLAEETQITPAAAETALRIACADHSVAKEATGRQAMWKRVIDNANASIGVAPGAPAANEAQPGGRWADAVRNANASIGAI